MQYLKLCFTILSVLEGPMHGDLNHLGTSTCISRHDAPLTNKMRHRDICQYNLVNAANINQSDDLSLGSLTMPEQTLSAGQARDHRNTSAWERHSSV
jgi:hypothetical protein